MRKAIERQWTPVLGAGYARGIASIKFFLYVTLIVMAVFWAAAAIIAVAGWAEALPLMLVLIFVPSASAIVGLVILFRFGQHISQDLRASGVNVREACFARSKSDVVAWSARNRVELAIVAQIGDCKYGVASTQVWSGQSMSQSQVPNCQASGRLPRSLSPGEGSQN